MSEAKQIAIGHKGTKTQRFTESNRTKTKQFITTESTEVSNRAIAIGLKQNKGSIVFLFLSVLFVNSVVNICFAVDYRYSCKSSSRVPRQ